MNTLELSREIIRKLNVFIDYVSDGSNLEDNIEKLETLKEPIKKMVAVYQKTGTDIRDEFAKLGDIKLWKQVLDTFVRAGKLLDHLDNRYPQYRDLIEECFSPEVRAIFLTGTLMSELMEANHIKSTQNKNTEVNTQKTKAEIQLEPKDYSVSLLDFCENCVRYQRILGNYFDMLPENDLSPNNMSKSSRTQKKLETVRDSFFHKAGDLTLAYLLYHELVSQPGHSRKSKFERFIGDYKSYCTERLKDNRERGRQEIIK